VRRELQCTTRATSLNCYHLEENSIPFIWFSRDPGSDRETGSVVSDTKFSARPGYTFCQLTMDEWKPHESHS
jgi:hypothetical protein